VVRATEVGGGWEVGAVFAGAALEEKPDEPEATMDALFR
jgi:hypothetical protein